MFRMGKNATPERTDNSKTPATTEKPDAAITPNALPSTSQQTPTPTQQQYQQSATQTPPPAPRNYEAQARTNAPETNTGRALSESESLARDIKEGIMSGFVGGGTVLSGDATFQGMLRVDGHLSGSVVSEKGTLIVSSGGRVDANISVSIARINGTVNGDIIATEKIELGRTAHLNGNIRTPALIIESGAIFEGSCRMSEQNLAQEPRPERREATANSQANMRPSPNANRIAAKEKQQVV